MQSVGKNVGVGFLRSLHLMGHGPNEGFPGLYRIINAIKELYANLQTLQNERTNGKALFYAEAFQEWRRQVCNLQDFFAQSPFSIDEIAVNERRLTPFFRSVFKTEACALEFIKQFSHLQRLTNQLSDSICGKKTMKEQEHRQVTVAFMEQVTHLQRWLEIKSRADETLMEVNLLKQLIDLVKEYIHPLFSTMQKTSSTNFDIYKPCVDEHGVVNYPPSINLFDIFSTFLSSLNFHDPEAARKRTFCFLWLKIALFSYIREHLQTAKINPSNKQEKLEENLASAMRILNEVQRGSTNIQEGIQKIRDLLGSEVFIVEGIKFQPFSESEEKKDPKQELLDQITDLETQLHVNQEKKSYTSLDVERKSKNLSKVTSYAIFHGLLKKVTGSCIDRFHQIIGPLYQKGNINDKVIKIAMWKAIHFSEMSWMQKIVTYLAFSVLFWVAKFFGTRVVNISRVLEQKFTHENLRIQTERLLESVQSTMELTKNCFLKRAREEGASQIPLWEYFRCYAKQSRHLDQVEPNKYTLPNFEKDNHLHAKFALKLFEECTLGFHLRLGFQAIIQRITSRMNKKTPLVKWMFHAAFLPIKIMMITIQTLIITPFEYILNFLIRRIISFLIKRNFISKFLQSKLEQLTKASVNRATLTTSLELHLLRALRGAASKLLSRKEEPKLIVNQEHEEKVLELLHSCFVMAELGPCQGVEEILATYHDVTHKGLKNVLEELLTPNIKNSITRTILRLLSGFFDQKNKPTYLVKFLDFCTEKIINFDEPSNPVDETKSSLIELCQKIHLALTTLNEPLEDQKEILAKLEEEYAECSFPENFSMKKLFSFLHEENSLKTFRTQFENVIREHNIEEEVKTKSLLFKYLQFAFLESIHRGVRKFHLSEPISPQIEEITATVQSYITDTNTGLIPKLIAETRKLQDVGTADEYCLHATECLRHILHFRYNILETLSDMQTRRLEIEQFESNIHEVLNMAKELQEKYTVILASNGEGELAKQIQEALIQIEELEKEISNLDQISEEELQKKYALPIIEKIKNSVVKEFFIEIIKMKRQKRLNRIRHIAKPSSFSSGPSCESPPQKAATSTMVTQSPQTALKPASDALDPTEISINHAVYLINHFSEKASTILQNIHINEFRLPFKISLEKHVQSAILKILTEKTHHLIDLFKKQPVLQALINSIMYNMLQQ